jgi:hypothetical protein
MACSGSYKYKYIYDELKFVLESPNVYEMFELKNHN